MPDKDYIKNVYDNLNTAYGANGVVQKGSFNRSFEDFSNQMQDSNYAKNIYHNLDVAYGKDGVVQKGAFNRSFEDFYGNVKKKKRLLQQAYSVVCRKVWRLLHLNPKPH